VKLVESHCGGAALLAAGIHAVPDANESMATTIAASRFFKNKRVTLRKLAEPLQEHARQEVPRVCDRYILVAHDWSQFMYLNHQGKKDRLSLSTSRGGKPDGYEVQTTLAFGDRDGSPIAPLSLSLRAADGVHCSRHWSKPRAPLSKLDELDPAMTHVDRLELPLPRVHIIDAEADSVAHYREWSARPNRLYVVRGDDRLVEYAGTEQRCSAIQAALRSSGALRESRDVLYHGTAAKQFVAEVKVRLLRPGQRNRPNSNDRQRIAGAPLELRLVISEVRSLDGELLATWFLLTNVPEDVDAATIALWYYWRWNIESFYKLLKSAGMHAEEWQQEQPEGIARRLLIASMACVVVWRLAVSEHPAARPARKLLMRLSGRQVRRGVEFTLPAMLAGLWNLLAMLAILDDQSLDEVRELAEVILGHPTPS